MEKINRKIRLNGEEKTIEASASARFLDVLRLDLKLMGTKEGCGEGECGACSIILNGEVVNSCLILFGQLKDSDIVLTIEGLGDAKTPNALQRCFVSEGGTQCGMCTPGMIMAAYALLMKNKSPTRAEISKALAGNLCRCTGYVKILDSVEKAAAIMRGDKK